MINISEAQSLVEIELSKMSDGKHPKDKRVTVNVLPIEGDIGWMFFYTTKAFAETQNPLYQLDGVGPIIVDREDGTLYITGTGKPLEEYIQEFRQKKLKRS